MITRYIPSFRTATPPQWRGPARRWPAAGRTAQRRSSWLARCSRFGQSRAFSALRLIEIVTAVHSHLNELATLEFGLEQLARLEDELPPDGALPGPLMLALSSRTRIGTVERANAIASATLSAEAQRRLTVMPIEVTTGYRRPDGQWPPRCPVSWLVSEFNARVASHVETPDQHDRRLGPDQFVVSLRHYRPAENELSRERRRCRGDAADGRVVPKHHVAEAALMLFRSRSGPSASCSAACWRARHGRVRTRTSFSKWHRHGSSLRLSDPPLCTGIPSWPSKTSTERSWPGARYRVYISIPSSSCAARPLSALSRRSASAPGAPKSPAGCAQVQPARLALPPELDRPLTGRG